MPEFQAGQETGLRPTLTRPQSIYHLRLWGEKAEETYKSALTKPFPSVSKTLKAWRMVSSGSVPRSSTHRQGERQDEEARQRLGVGQVPWPLQRPRAQGASSPALVHSEAREGMFQRNKEQ